MKQSDFYWEEDIIIRSECQNCGAVYYGEVEECEDCGCLDLINETEHEGRVCVICGKWFEMFDNGYRGNGILICEECYENLEED